MTKLWIHLVLAVLTCAGFVHNSAADPVTFDLANGFASEATTTAVYDASGCEGVASHFASNPIPIGAIDADTGEEIVGWEILCPNVVVAQGGTPQGSGGTRFVPRAFGGIRVKYAP